MITYIAQTLNLNDKAVKNTVALLDEGATIPFISRYRKEATGGLDEVEIGNISTMHQQLCELNDRKKTILQTIEEQGQLTAELKAKIEATHSSKELEDIYLPYKPKRRTKATIAREKGLEPLAKILMSQGTEDPERSARSFLNKEVESEEDALAGARDIMAEWISERQATRDIVRRHFKRSAVLKTKVIKGKEEEGDVYRDYFNVEQSAKHVSSHRFLAIQRAANEGILRFSIHPDAEATIENLERLVIKSRGKTAKQVELAVKDAYKRLVLPSIENETIAELKQKADEEAIAIFTKNLRQLLLAPPAGNKRTLAIDPGFRTGCKVVCLDEKGDFLHNATIYPHPPQNKGKEAMRKLSQLMETYKIENISIGNGTAGRETEQLIKRMRMPQDVAVYVVNEAGASIYSASSEARAEFPDYDVTVRGAISIGRRLMDPLAELVKIDPKSIGVGQYQHDVNQTLLGESLKREVEYCVNLVGVDLNTASYHLLSYVSGIGPTMAKRIVEYRTENGTFDSRQALKKVKGMGAKTFEQCAGFLRIRESKDVLDNTAVHPESYKVVEKIAKSLACKSNELVRNSELIKTIRLEDFISEKVGLPTLKDIISELEKPGRDPRPKPRIFSFDANISKFEDLQVGMVLPGIVNNIAKFGAFVDIGIKQNGLIHVSEIADRFISDPTEELSLGEQVRVKIIEIDSARKRIALSLKQV